MKCTF